jgi:hypothetical protein
VGRSVSAPLSRAERPLLALAVALPIALARTTFLVVPTTDGAWRGLVDPPGPWRLAIAVALGALIATLARNLAADVRRPLLAGLLAAAPLVPVLTGFGTPLLAFGAPLMTIVLCGAVGVAIARAASEDGPLTTEAAWCVAPFLFYLALGTSLPGAAGPQGDEPHYLLTAESLWTDGDVDLRDELETRAYAPYYSGTLAPHTSPASPPERAYSIHAPGLAALLLPAYALGGYPAVRTFLSLIAATTVWLVYRLVRAQTGRAGPAAAAAAALSLTPPLAFYAVAVYPETPVALACALFLLAASFPADGRWRAAAVVAAAIVPWLHPKYLPLAAVGLLLSCRWRTPRANAAAAAVFAASVALLLVFMHAHYGRASLSAAYGQGFNDDVTPERALWGAPALLFDRQFGLFAIAPVWLLAVPGAALLFHRSRHTAAAAVLLAASAFAVNASFSMWWGGTCPPARFLVPCLPVLACLVAEVAPLRRTLTAALVGGGLGVVALAAEAPRALHNRADGESALLRVLARGLDLDHRLPSFVLEEKDALLLSVSLLAVFALLWLRGARGLAAGAAGYALLAAGLRPGSMLDTRGATLALVDGYDDRALVSVTGPVRPETLRVPLELAEAPWDFQGPGAVRRSRPVDLAPGRYRVEIDAVIMKAVPTAHVVRVDIVAEDESLAFGYVEDGKPLPVLELDLRERARRVRVEAAGIQDEARINAVTVVPVSIAVRRERAGR